MTYKIKIYQNAQKQLLALPSQERHKVVIEIDKLEDTPRQHGCKKLRDTNLWRIRIGQYRIVYEINDRTELVTILKIARRREDTYK